MALTAHLQFTADISEFSSLVSSGGSPAWNSGSIAGFNGRVGFTFNSTNPLYGIKTGLTTSDEFRYQLLVSLGTLTMASSDHFRTVAVPNDNNAIHALAFQKTAGGVFQLAASMYNDGFASENKTVVNWGGWSRLEVHCKRGAAGAGFCKVYGDADLTTPIISITGISNNTVWGTNGGCASFRVGAILGVDAGTSGTFYVTQFKMENTGTVIGSASEPPINTVPVDTGGIFVTSGAARAITGMSVAEGSSAITSVLVSVPVGKGQWVFDATGTSVVLTGNGTSAVLMTGGANVGQYNTVLATALCVGGANIHERVPVTLDSSDGTLLDSKIFYVLCDVRQLTITATVPNFSSLVAAVNSMKMKTDVGSLSGSCVMTATDATFSTDIETITLSTTASGSLFFLIMNASRKGVV